VSKSAFGVFYFIDLKRNKHWATVTFTGCFRNFKWNVFILDDKKTGFFLSLFSFLKNIAERVLVFCFII